MGGIFWSKGMFPCGPVYNVAQALSDPSVLARNMVVPVNHLGEEIKMLGNPLKMSEMGEEVFAGRPDPGAAQRGKSFPSTSGTPRSRSRI